MNYISKQSELRNSWTDLRFLREICSYLSIGRVLLLNAENECEKAILWRNIVKSHQDNFTWRYVRKN